MKTVLKITYWLAILCAGIVAVKFAMGSVSHRLIGIAAVGCIISIVKSIKSDDYIKGTLSLSQKGGNVPVFDYIRCFAVICVITIHVVALDMILVSGQERTLYIENLDFIRWWCLNCNMIFVMLSGALLLPYKEESVFAFYGKRLTRILIPLVVYFLWYAWAFGQMGDGILSIVKKIVTADFTNTGTDHFWLIYVLVGVYIFMVFLRDMLKNYPYERLTGLVIVLLILLAFSTYVPLNIEIGGEYLFWCGVAVVGYWCTKDETRKYDTALIIAGIVTSIVVYLIYKFNPQYETLLGNLSPYRLIMSAGVFSVFFKLKEKLKSFYLIRLISKYSYGIMLVHYWVVGYLERKIGVNTVERCTGIGPLVSIAVALVLSFIATYLIDNLVCVIFTSLIDLFKKKKQ